MLKSTSIMFLNDYLEQCNWLGNDGWDYLRHHCDTLFSHKCYV